MYTTPKHKLLFGAVVATVVAGITCYGAQRSPGAYMPLFGFPRRWNIPSVHAGLYTLARGDEVVVKQLDLGDERERARFLELLPMYAFDAYFVAIRRPRVLENVYLTEPDGDRVVVTFSQQYGSHSYDQSFELANKEGRDRFWAAMYMAGSNHQHATTTRTIGTWETQMLKQLPLGLGRLVTDFCHGVRKMFR